MERIKYIDTLKGILIIMVVAHHIPYFALDILGFNNDFFSSFKYLRQFIYGPFFMTTFFVCTGMCSNFDKPFVVFAKGVVKVAIPTYILLRYTHWFIDAFIISKILYWLIHKYIHNNYYKFLIVVMLAIIGCVLHNDRLYYEFFSWHHGVEMVFFVYIGHQWKNALQKTNYTILASILYIGIAVICFFYFQNIPSFEQGFHVTYRTLVPFLFISVSGVMMSIGIAKLIDNPFLQFVGRMSIVVFLMHLVLMPHVIARFRNMINSYNGNSLGSFLIFMLIWLITTGLCLIIAKVLDHKYLRWIIGK